MKDMKWDPTTEPIDDLAYKYKELGNSLGLNEESILIILRLVYQDNIMSLFTMLILSIIL